MGGGGGGGGVRLSELFVVICPPICPVQWTLFIRPNLINMFNINIEARGFFMTPLVLRSILVDRAESQLGRR